MPENDTAKRRAVRLDELARQENEARGVGSERRPARPQERSDLGREAVRADVGIEPLLGVDDAGFRRVGDDEAQIAGDADLQKPAPLRVRVERKLHRRDDAAVDDLATVDTAAQEHGIKVLLRLERPRRAARPRLGDRDAAVESPLLVGDVDHPVDEAAQEDAVADLKDLDRGAARGRRARPLGGSSSGRGG